MPYPHRPFTSFLRRRYVDAFLRLRFCVLAPAGTFAVPVVYLLRARCVNANHPTFPWRLRLGVLAGRAQWFGLGRISASYIPHVPSSAAIVTAAARLITNTYCITSEAPCQIGPCSGCSRLERGCLPAIRLRHFEARHASFEPSSAAS